MCARDGNKVQKAMFLLKVNVQGHRPWCHLKGFHYFYLLPVSEDGMVYTEAGVSAQWRAAVTVAAAEGRLYLLAVVEAHLTQIGSVGEYIGEMTARQPLDGVVWVRYRF